MPYLGVDGLGSTRQMFDAASEVVGYGLGRVFRRAGDAVGQAVDNARRSVDAPIRGADQAARRF